jgi:hypothetical protein
VQYAVTLGSRSLSALPRRAASLLAVGSFILVYCTYTSRPLSSSSISSLAGSGRSFSFWAVLVVRCGPILGAGGPRTGAPELFLLRNLLLSDDSMGWPAWAAPGVCMPDEYDRVGWLGGIEDETVGLNVTVRWGFAGICCRAVANDEIRGVVSVVLDAIAMDLSRVDIL